MFSVKGCILSFLSGAFFFFLVLSSGWWIPTGIAFWLVYFFMESRRTGSPNPLNHPNHLNHPNSPEESRTFSPGYNKKKHAAADDTYNV